jgi:hypothetical protein
VGCGGRGLVLLLVLVSSLYCCLVVSGSALLLLVAFTPISPISLFLNVLYFVATLVCLTAAVQFP